MWPINLHHEVLLWGQDLMKYKKWQNRSPPFHHQVLSITVKIGSHVREAVFQAIMFQHAALPEVLETTEARAIGEEDRNAANREDSTTITGRRTPTFKRPYLENVDSKQIRKALVNGIKIKFIETLVQTRTPPPLRFTDTGNGMCRSRSWITSEKGVIHRVEPCDGQFVYIFLRPKTSGCSRPIINLKRLNSFIEHNHFKMENLLSVLHLIKEGVYMTSLDLKYAYFALPISNQFNNIYNFNGKRPCMNLSAYALALVPYRITSRK